MRFKSVGINNRVCGFVDLGVVGSPAHVTVHNAGGFPLLVEVMLLGKCPMNDVVVDHV
jgi:hypothetical protein